MRLVKALTKLEGFKNEKLINQLRKASFGKQLGQGSGSKSNIVNDGFDDFDDLDLEDDGYLTTVDSELEEEI